jgi:hypothetical protein
MSTQPMLARYPNCVSKKKPFATQTEAVSWEANNRAKYPTNPQQHPYKCEDCPAWHLTSKSPDASGLAQVDYAKFQRFVPPSERRPRGETTAKVLDLHGQGFSTPQIAARLGVSAVTVYYHLNKETGKTWKGNPTVITLDTLSQKESELQRQLHKVQVEKERLIELKKLKLESCWGGTGVLLSKEGNKLALGLEDARLLVDKLTDILTNPYPPKS